MSPDRRDAVKSVFCRALELPEDERAGFIARSLDDPADRAEVESLLHWYSADFLAAPAVDEEDSEPDWRAATPAESQNTEEFGPYQIVRELGHGGMGTVYLAQRQDELAGYPVALKVISAGEDKADLEARLRMEMRALTKLRHPHIVSVLDAGITTRGRLYLAMEYVDGVSLDVFCRENRLSNSGRLKLFTLICDAVAHAHRNLVIHRDLKPSNILVTAGGHPKLVDFGLAKILSADSAETLTTMGRWRISLRYASPEQIQGVDLTTATDVYSLGVILYELRTGASPYGSDSDPMNVLHAVLNKDPLRPQDAFEKVDRDLEAILLKALRKEPQARYPSVDEFRADIENYLRGSPVAARHGNSAYVLWKFVRRHTVRLAAVALILALIGAMGVIWHDADRSRHNLDQALNMASRLPASLDYGLLPADRGAFAAMARQIADLLIIQAQRQGIGREARVAILDRLIAIAELLGHPTGNINLGNVAGGVHILRQALSQTEELYARYPADPAFAALASRNYRSLGTLLIEEDDYQGAASLFKRSCSVDRARMKHWPAESGPLTDYADSLANLSRISFHDRDAAECLRLGYESVGFRRRAALASPEKQSYWYDLGHGLSNYCFDLADFGHYRESLAVCQESNSILSTVLSFPPNRRMALRLLADNAEQAGRAYAGLGRSPEAIANFEEGVRRFRQLQEEIPLDTSSQRHLAMCLSRLAEARFKAGRIRPARAAAEEAMRLASASADSDPTNTKEQLALQEIRERTRSIVSTAR